MRARSGRCAVIWALGAAALGACDVAQDVPAIAPLDTSDAHDVLHGDVTIVASPEDALALRRLKHIVGDVEIRAGQALALPDLVEIDGSLRIVGGLIPAGAEPRATPVVSLPALQRVAGRFAVSDGTFAIDTPQLVTIGGDWRATDVALASISFPALETIGGSVQLARFSAAASDGRALTAALPVLRAVGGGVELSDGPSFTFAAPALTTVGVDLEIADVVVSLDLGALREIGDDLRVEHATIDALTLGALETIRGDLLVTSSEGKGLERFEPGRLATVVGDIRLTDLGSLRAIGLDALVDLGRALVVSDNPQLTNVSARVLGVTHGDVIVHAGGVVRVSLEGLTTVGGDLRIEDSPSMELHAPLLEAVTGSLVVRNGSLARLGASALQAVGRDVLLTDLAVEGHEVVLDRLSAVGGTVAIETTRFLERVIVSRLRSVGSIQGGFPIGDLVLTDNQHLVYVGATGLLSVTRDLTVRANPALDAQTIGSAFGTVSVGGAKTICGNRDDSACAP